MGFSTADRLTRKQRMEEREEVSFFDAEKKLMSLHKLGFVSLRFALDFTIFL